MTSAPEAAAGQDWPRALRAAGRRVTRQRLTVLDVAHATPHATAEMILADARSALPSLTPQSVYQVLADLSEIGLLRKLQTPGAPARYETRIGDNHHHVMCIRCGRVDDVDCVIGEAPCLVPGDTAGMRIVAADVLFRGICAACEANAGAEH
ncbi:MAG TPA: Fur family transcriptional regulator [Ruania sp.]|nr:Fur family transcriptional regulator [Ruania sp.]